MTDDLGDAVQAESKQDPASMMWPDKKPHEVREALEELPQPEPIFDPTNPNTWRDPSVVVEGFLSSPGPITYSGSPGDLYKHFGSYGFEEIDHGFGPVLYCHTDDGGAIVVPKGWWVIPGTSPGTFTVKHNKDQASAKTTAPTFISKPAEIRAIQFRGDNVNEIWDAFGTTGIYGPTEKNPNWLILTTAHGDTVTCNVGHWVVPDVQPDTFYPVKPEVFEKRWKPGSLTNEAEKPSHRVSILVDVNDRQWPKIFGQFNELVENLGTEYPSAHVISSTLPDPDEGVTDSEDTLFKVYDALKPYVGSYQGATDAINAMLNAGILFRERA